MLKLKETKMGKLNKYILTRKVRLILAIFAILTAVFYFFTSVNLAVRAGLEKLDRDISDKAALK